MQLKISKYAGTFLLFGATLFASEILSDAQKSSLELQKEKAVQDSEARKYEWIKPVNFNYGYTDNNEIVGSIPKYTSKSSITIDQPIFKSGGIESTMKYAENLKASSSLSIEQRKKELIKKALNLAFSIKKTNLLLEQQKLLLANAKIDLRIKKESVTNGLLDISFLNNAILTKNNIDAKILELEFNKINLTNSFKNVSTLDPYKVELPVLTKVDRKDFDEKHLKIQQTKVDIEMLKNKADITTSNYLPNVSVNGGFNIDHKDSDRTSSYTGIRLSIPLDYNYYANTSSVKVDYLKSKQDLEILRTEEANFFQIQELKIAMLDSKLTLTKENIGVYDDLLAQNKELAGVGIKTQDDVQVIQNSRDSELLNIKIFEIDKQLELLEIYGKIENATI
ncbi:MAG: TolC family protein [Epsilonproteobacteria bacterium]|nr:TolC family protein [Campylobacterota bacterium]